MGTGEQAQFDVLTMYAAGKSVWSGFLVGVPGLGLH
jgi:hypothetical protein